MKNKRTRLLMYLLPGILLTIALINSPAGYSQATPDMEEAIRSAQEFTGAKADKPHYSAIFQLNTDDPKVIEGAIRNITNALNDPRLKGKLEVELVAYSAGWQIFNKDNPYGEKLLALKKRGVILAQCQNTLHERNIPLSQILSFVSIVPTGNGELIIRESQGWAIVKP